MTQRQNTLNADLALVALLVALDVAARLLPHAPNFTPVAASALFVATMLRTRWLAFVVPVAALMISDVFIGFDSSAMRLITYALFTLPALVAFLPARSRAAGLFVPVIIGYSLLFFAVSNFATWLLTDMYPHTLAGLATCYALALPFLPQTLMGDLVWTALLFGGAALVAMAPRKARTA